MNDVNSIVICKEEYDTTQKFYDAIRDAVMVLLNNNYIMTVVYEEKGLGIVRIDYETAYQEYGAPYPYWLYPEEYESIVWEDSEDDARV